MKIRLELLLFLAVVLLIAQLSWPAAARWWNLPSPGSIGVDHVEHPTLAADYLVGLPEDYNDKPQPLIVFLHGAGERGNDANMLRDHGPIGLKLPAIVAAPQCLPGYNWEPGAVVGVIQDVASKYHVDSRRIYLIGYSMGGYGTWRAAAAYPELFAAIVPICGGGEPDDAATLVSIPTWAFHGARDDVVPVKESEQMIEAIRDVGGQPKFTVISHAGHGICDSVCSRSDLWEWLLRQRRETNDR